MQTYSTKWDDKPMFSVDLGFPTAAFKNASFVDLRIRNIQQNSDFKQMSTPKTAFRNASFANLANKMGQQN